MSLRLPFQSGLRQIQRPRHSTAIRRVCNRTPRKYAIIMASASKNPSVLIPIANGSEEMEAIIIADVLRRAEAQVTLASVEETTQVTCSRGVNIVADKVCRGFGYRQREIHLIHCVRLQLIGECAEEQFELIALPGGMPGAQNLADSEMLSSILKKHQASDKPLAAICAAPQVVLNTQGYLEGRHATAHPAFSDKLGNQERVSDRVVIDGNIITSRGPGTAMEFALTIVGRLFGPEKMKQVAGPMVMHSDWDTFVA